MSKPSKGQSKDQNKEPNSSLQSFAIARQGKEQTEPQKAEPNWEKLVSLPQKASEAYVYGCSPRPNGNSDFASMLIEDELAECGLDYDGCFLREHKLSACGGCQKCGDLGDEICRLARHDETKELFDPILASKLLFFVSPIYFYHVPAQFKTFIDRGQAYWVQRSLGSPVMLNLPKRRAHVILLCARESGEKMFAGSLLTLRFFLSPFNIELAEPLLIRGLDGPNDLAANDDLQQQILNYTRQACEQP